MFLLWAAITDFHAFCMERWRGGGGKKIPIPGLNIFSIEHQCFSRRIWGVIWSGEAVPRRVMRAPSTYAWPWLMREKMPFPELGGKRIGKTGRAHLRKCDTYPRRFRVSVTEWWLMCWLMRGTRRLTRLAGDLISWLQLPDPGSSRVGERENS